jgi:hypothetical protein
MVSRTFPRIDTPDWYAQTPSDALADTLECQYERGEPLCPEMVFEALNRYFDLEQEPPRPVDPEAWTMFVVEGDGTSAEVHAKIDQHRKDNNITGSIQVVHAKDWPHQHTPVTELAAQLLGQHQHGQPLDTEIAFAAISALLAREHPAPEVVIHC